MRRLRKKSIIILAGQVLAACWFSASPLSWRLNTQRGQDLFIAPNATEIQIQSLALGEQQITYRTGGAHPTDGIFAGCAQSGCGRLVSAN